MNQEHDITTTLELGDAAGSHMPLTVEVVHDDTRFLSLRDEWNALAASAMSTAYQTHEWASLWWKHFGGKSHQRLFILVLRCDNVMIGIAPFIMEHETLLGASLHRRLTLIGSGTAFQDSFGMFLDDGPSDYLDMIVAPGYESQATQAIAEYLHQSNHRIDEMALLNIPQESIVVSMLVPAFEKSGFTCTARRADVCPYLPVPGSVNDYLQNANASVRRRLNQAQKAADEGTLYTISEMNSLHDYTNALEHIITLHQQRWNRIGYPGLFADNSFRAFQQELLAAFYRNGWLWCKTANADGTCVAARLAFKFNNTMFDYLSGFDDTAPAAKRRPGLALLLSMIHDAVREKMHRIDFLRGDEQYKFELTSEVRYNTNVVAMRAHHSSSLRYYLWRAAALVNFFLYLTRREWKLLKVQFRQYPVYSFVFHYVKFRVPMLTSKLKRMSDKKQ